ncbi:hypothetical protein QE375_002943 [Microbacterium foliorum]|uniref:GAF domain-containing protein n=1 Tax=Microbacterium foliorum TaxID=104336 RepID=A0ABU1HVV3_9MICO|nr:hypothetical protein [Microbacterium foliorum]MDR6143389.1 hypothetical protein [Microbacterium foliorum]
MVQSAKHIRQDDDMVGAFGLSTEERLQQIADAVAVAIGGQSQCIVGVALLCELSKHFGYALTPRAVSLAAQSAATGRAVATGALAADFIRKHGGSSEVVGYAGASPNGSEFQRAGHLVATFGRPFILIDPTFEQFSAAGFPKVAPVVAILPGEGEVLLEGPDFQAVCLFDDENGDWQDSFEKVREASREVGLDIANHLKAGQPPHTHDVRF